MYIIDKLQRFKRQVTLKENLIVSLLNIFTKAKMGFKQVSIMTKLKKKCINVNYKEKRKKIIKRTLNRLYILYVEMTFF